MSVERERVGDPFDGGPPMRLQRALGLATVGDAKFARRAALVALAAWLPLAVLAIVDGFATGEHRILSFLGDYAVHARLLLAAPLLVLAEKPCIARLGGIGRHFLEVGLVPESARGRYESIVQSTRRLRDSPSAEIAAVVLAYTVVALLIAFAQPSSMPRWHVAVGGTFPALSPAGWWHLLVSLPLLLVLFIGWLWRLFLWTRFLWLIARLDLRLVPVHPDGFAGLAFVGHSVRSFATIAMAMGCVLAGRMAEQVLHHGHSPGAFAWPAAGLLAAVALLFGAPLAVFGPPLLRAYRRGVFTYGALASRMGQSFEHKWLTPGADAGRDALEMPDFSATTDLYQIASNSYRVRPLPLDLVSLLLLAAATLLPFIPVLVITLPFRVIIDGIGKLLV